MCSVVIITTKFVSYNEICRQRTTKNKEERKDPKIDPKENEDRLLKGNTKENHVHTTVTFEIQK